MPDTAVTLSFAEADRLFWLPMPQVIELERRCEDASVFAIYERLGAASASCLEVSESRVTARPGHRCLALNVQTSGWGMSPT